MERRSLVVLSAGLGQPSSTRLLADRLAAEAVDALAGRGLEAGTTVVEVRDLARDLADHLVANATSPALRTALDAVAGADAVVAVTPVFAASYSGLFKTFVDALDRDALTGVPVVVGATAGTQRHSLVLEHAMRPLFAHLRALVLPTAVFAAPEDWGGEAGRSGDALSARVSRAAGELAEVVAGRPARRPHDPFEDAPSFADLLSGR
ncbi:CE1759 family FMN reductase [uncultured Pseudokineococcus sp.]|uniref:CE1759 family FMN reductase n=1 Tax=uncultured Pseudokineococcus sp. TaxID=1642928 RepID=UPI0026093AB7|nr:CE1759 family FMN reductase [uncultured Pseudokineococcus sp.]